ncbi:DUF2147 domain-containing protein [Comamonas composti]|uniref:DUF2147 domain-containing protein n=1 Tax=Comamonas composti TaxID=408558 RepID=UPI0003FBE91E|nr:DUF2147 domain-containing protein [Comamonas composti]
MKVYQALTAIVFAATGFAAQAQMTPLGLWKNIDDKTGEAKAEIRITEKDGQLSGRIEKTLRKNTPADAVCTECSDDRKGQPVVGLEILRGGKQTEGKNLWEGGKVLDPESGKEYRGSLTPIEGGARMELRGYWGPFWRTQTWVRIQ